MTIENFIMLGIILICGIGISLYVGSEKCNVAVTIVGIFITLTVVMGFFW